MTRRRMVVKGRVQGVGYRVNCVQVAQELGVAGTVRNMPDGSVEVIAVGTAAAVDRLTTWCRNGPRWATVESLHYSDTAPGGANTDSTGAGAQDADVPAGGFTIA